MSILALNPSRGNIDFYSRPELNRAIVSGQSITGMLAAIILAQSGYQVECFEVREKYTRNIQWAVRQSLVDQLASIDKELANLFIKEVISPIHKGSIHVYADGYRRTKNHDPVGLGNPSNLPLTCDAMMAKPSVAIVEAKVFEACLKNYLQSQKNVCLYNKKFNIQSYKGENAHGPSIPDLIVIAEGSNSQSRNALNIKLTKVAKEKMQIAGTLSIDSGGLMLKHWRKEDHDIRLTGIMGKAELKSTWMVADVDPNKADMNAEFQRLAAHALNLPIEEVKKLNISGAIESQPVKTFFLNQAISETATDGDNVILIGDAVGNGHWSVGGGMQTGSVCHIERLKTLLVDIKQKMPKASALKKYSEAVIKDTKTWIETSTKDEDNPRLYKTTEELSKTSQASGIVFAGTTFEA